MKKIKPLVPSPVPEFKTPRESQVARERRKELEERITERRREHLRALRACRLQERQLLRQLAESRYAPYSAGKALGISTWKVAKMLRRPRVQRAMALYLEDALDTGRVSHASLVADLIEIKERCLQARPIQDASGRQVFVRLRSGKVAAAYSFDARGATAAVKELAELLKLVPAKQVQVTSTSISLIANATARMAQDMQNITDPTLAAQAYQQLMYGALPANDGDTYDQASSDD